MDAYEAAASVDRNEQENESLFHEMRVPTGITAGATPVAKRTISGAVGSSPIGRHQMLTLLRDIRVQSHQALAGLEDDDHTYGDTVGEVHRGVNTIFDRFEALAAARGIGRRSGRPTGSLYGALFRSLPFGHLAAVSPLQSLKLLSKKEA